MNRHVGLRIVFWSAAAFAFVMAILPSPPNLLESNDKVQHMVAFGVLTVLGAIAYPRRSWLQLLFGLSLFGAFIEAVQAIPALHRDSDIKDWIADIVAAGLAIALVVLWRSRSRSIERDRPAD